MNEPTHRTSDQQDVLTFLKYDVCEAAEKCEPCKGVRQMAIAEIERLRAREKLLLASHTGCGCEPNCPVCREKGFT